MVNNYLCQYKYFLIVKLKVIESIENIISYLSFDSHHLGS